MNKEKKGVKRYMKLRKMYDVKEKKTKRGMGRKEAVKIVMSKKYIFMEMKKVGNAVVVVMMMVEMNRYQ